MRKILTCGLLLTYFAAAAQHEFDTWCFGWSQQPVAPDTSWGGGIKLRFGATRPVTPADRCQLFYYGPGRSGWNIGSKTGISSAAGTFLFYTTGLSVNDRRNRPMPHGDLRLIPSAFDTVTRTFDPFWAQGGGPLEQVATIAPGPDGLYYVFHWSKVQQAGQPVAALTYCTVDMRLNGGYGDVTTANHLLGTTTRPRMALVRHRNNRDFWVITRDFDSRGFRAYLLGRAGVNPVPVVSMAGEGSPPDYSDLRAAPNGRRLTCGARTSANGAAQVGICLFDFDNATGRVSNEQVIRRLAVADVTSGFLIPHWAASFSPNSQVLYTTEANPPPLQARKRWSDLWQYDLQQPTAAAIEQSRYWGSDVAQLPAPDEDFGAASLQLTPHGEVWADALRRPAAIRVNHAFPPDNIEYRAQASAIIRRPDVLGAGCGLEVEGYFYVPGQTPLWFPNIITNMLYAPPALNHEQGCADDSTQFWASSAGMAAGLRWDFGDPGSGPANTANGSQVAHRYAHSGSYPVRLLLADGRVLTQVVTVAAQTADFTGANVFTPNNDGFNDAFMPVRGALPGGRLRVFSRWGIPVFGTDDAEALRWDGAGAAGGEYFYQLDYPDCQGQPRHRRGVVTLVR